MENKEIERVEQKEIDKSNDIINQIKEMFSKEVNGLKEELNAFKATKPSGEYVYTQEPKNIEIEQVKQEIKKDYRITFFKGV